MAFLLNSAFHIDPLLLESGPRARHVWPEDAMNRLLARTVALEVEKEICVDRRSHRLTAQDDRLLRRLVFSGVCGLTVEETALAAAASPSTLRRWCKRHGLGTPHLLLQVVRHCAAMRLRRRGVCSQAVAAACGWPSSKAMIAARARLKKIVPVLGTADSVVEMLDSVD
ncbi:MAG: hypothetical protein RRA92_06290 [Gemmatimonadota bacterium]|nr:hypothetical protein [Gemmatimonadota bacterium]